MKIRILKLIGNWKLEIGNSRRGVSLPLVTGLVALLMVSSAAANELVIRNMQSVQRIEASNRAYLAAEAGIEDALYELSPHFAGYQTQPFGDSDVRSNIFDESGDACDAGDGGDWCNEWVIESRSGQNNWEGKFFPKQKLIIQLYNDNNNSNEGFNAINDGPFSANEIQALNNLGVFKITFRMPDDVIENGKLFIDNDQDGLLNEDPEGAPNPINCFIDEDTGALANPEDHDCDGLVNEDSRYDPVILWKLTDGGDKSLIPIKGCMEINDNPGTQPCEDDFGPTSSPLYNEGAYAVLINQNTDGVNEKGEIESTNNFISRATDFVTGSPNAKIQFEFLIIAPMEHIQGITRVEIPYFEYDVYSSNSTDIPYPYFSIKSDGYYRQFKQSITSTVTPKTTTPLFDFTIIQQE